ncbi:MAG: serine/threonine protein phosphatase [Crenarchaeota archaeon]|nr:serine/threonine protein phosphatase [Thermoproteota archaeon]
MPPSSASDEEITARGPLEVINLRLKDLPVDDLASFAEVVASLSEQEAEELLLEGAEVLSKDGKVVSSQPDARTVFHGDLHGDIVTLYDVWELLGLKNVLSSYKLVFLGDYVDRGPKQLEALLLVLVLKAKRPSEVFVLRGNHEPFPGLEPLPHDFPQHLAQRFRDWKRVYGAAKKVFDAMPLSLLVEGAVVAYHGGPATVLLRRGCKGVSCIYGDPEREVVEEILWNDPANVCGWDDGPEECWSPSPRGRGVLWGPGATRYLLNAVGVKYIVRANTPVDGVAFYHGGKVVSVFTRKGTPFFNKRAGVWAPDFLDSGWHAMPSSWAVVV